MILIDAPVEYNQSWMRQAMSEVGIEIERCLKRQERIYVGNLVDTELVLIAPDGTKYRIKVDNSGVLSTESVI